ncbi:glycosyltransferase family 2 protein [Bifidobacterium choloepi]|uniref:Glycosyltransferase n=1 Tax=Bifidobacterium choloepi TaxID=2614131 RepID=A0A6I5NCU0_9BIFI|nr:glycosyltransferase [Bifidobacterium choloepi]NEG70360.1 glycosyltransferase [Bifidobacterium choloepi]
MSDNITVPNAFSTCGSSPSVTIVIPTYRRSLSLLQRAVDSVLMQRYDGPMELIIVDDNHGDEFASSVADFVTSIDIDDRFRVMLLVNDGINGAARARNLALAGKTRGKYIAFLDDDDYWIDEDKLAKQVAALEVDEEAVLTFSHGYYEEDDGDRTPYFTVSFQSSQPTLADMLENDCVGTPSQVLIRKTALDRTGGFNTSLPVQDDYELWVRLRQCGTFIRLPEYTFVRSRHAGEHVTGFAGDRARAYAQILAIHRDVYGMVPMAWGHVALMQRRYARQSHGAVAPVSVKNHWRPIAQYVLKHPRGYLAMRRDEWRANRKSMIT